MSFLDNAADCLPQPPGNAVVRVRTMDGQHFTAGAFFAPVGTSRSGMARCDVVSLAAVTIDVDAYAWDAPTAVARWGATRDERKTAMRSASEAEVLAWFEEVGLVDMVVDAVAATGAPQPNRVVYTGQGLALVYWLSADEGNKTGEWNADRIRSALRRWSPKVWWFDESAKDAGTRLFPVPGGRHRKSGKRIQVLRRHDERASLAPWLARVESLSKLPTNHSGLGRALQKIETLPSGVALPLGGRGPCPSCGGATRLRRLDRGYHCFSCRVWFRLPFAPADETERVPLDARGHAQWPPLADRVVLSARTGSGKTHVLAAEVARYPFRVVAVSPTIALAHAMGVRLGLRVVGAADPSPGPNESVVVCFAGLQRIGVGIHPDIRLGNTLLVIDEVESCLTQLLTMLKKADGTAIYNKLIRMVGYCGRAILSDAHAGDLTARLLADVAADRVGRGDAPLTWQRLKTDTHTHSFCEVMPKTENGKTVLSATAVHEGRIFFAVAAGRRVAIYVPGRGRALALAAALRERFPEKRINCIVRPRSEDERPDLSDTALLADALVYNNAMSTGVSIDADGWYDERHVLLSSAGGVVDGTMIEQAAHRVRRPKNDTIWISGGNGEPPDGDDWRLDADQHLRRGLDRLVASEEAANRYRGARIQLLGDENCSAESLRLARLQSVALAARYRSGWRWTAAWLRDRHSWQGVTSAGDETAHDAVASTQARLDRTAAEAVAVAEPMITSEYEEGILPPDAATADRVDSGRLDRLYGDASRLATKEERAALYLDDRSGLYRRCQVFAAVEIWRTGDPAEIAALRKWDERSVRAQTVVVSRPIFALSAAIAGVLEACAGLAEITPTVAALVLARIDPLRVAADLPPVDPEQPIAALGTLLARAGIRLVCKRVGPRGKRVRVYRIDDASVDAMSSRAAAARRAIALVETVKNLETA